MWKEARKIIGKIQALYADENRFVENDCNCDACVVERIGDQSKDLFDRLHKFYSRDLGIFEFSSDRFRMTFNSMGISTKVNHKSKQERIMIILDEISKINQARAKRIPKSRTESCRDCGMLVNSNLVKTTTVVNGKTEYICNNCSEHYSVCEYCGELHTRNRLRAVTHVKEDGHRGRRLVCPDCLTTKLSSCSFCGDFHEKEGITEVTLDGRGPQRICPHCREHRIRTCVECGLEMYMSDTSIRRPLCSECHTYRKDILPWNFRPRPIFLLNTDKEEQFKDTLFFGVELEIEKLGRCKIENGHMSRYVRKLWPSKHVYCVHDGSLESGFEIVSQPFTWSRFIKDRPLWDATFDLFHKHAYSTGPSAGMHVHMSKEAFSTVHLYKFVSFLYKESTRQFIQAIAQRKLGENQYCKFDKIDVENTHKLAKHKDNLSADKHHAAVNLENVATIETRVFAMPAESDGMFKNLEFMHALYVFSKENKYKDMIVSKFLDFLTDPQHRGRYRHLISFLTGNQYLKKSFPSYYKKLQ